MNTSFIVICIHLCAVISKTKLEEAYHKTGSDRLNEKGTCLIDIYVQCVVSIGVV